MDCAASIASAKDVVVACAAAFTAFSAYRGLKKWREELSGKADFEVARALARATYRLRDEMQAARSPLIRAAEFPDGYMPGLPSTTDEQHTDAWAAVYRNRWEPVKTALLEFNAQSLEAEALWGPGMRSLLEEISKCATQLFASMEAKVSNVASGNQDFEHDRAYARTIRADLSTANAEENPLTKRINAAVAAIEVEVRKHLTRG